MPQTAITQQGDSLDLVVFRTIGVVNESLLEETHTLNPSVSNYGATLPFGIEVTVPDAPSDGDNITRSIKLYD